MRSAMRFAMVAMLATTIGSAKPKTSPLRFTLQIEAEDHCQLSPVTQGLTLHLRLKIVNLGDSLEVQDAGRPGLILLGKTVDGMKKEIYEFRSQSGEYADPPLPPNKTAIRVKPGGSFETTQPIGLTIAQQGAAPPGQIVESGSHYLQVGTAVTVGDTNPSTWRSIPVLSEPIPVRIEYSPGAAPCPRNEPEPIPGAPR
jgi:hypothetical protein